MKKLHVFLALMFILLIENVLLGQTAEIVKPDFSEWGVSFRAIGIGALKDAPFSQAFDTASLNIKYTKNERIFYRLGLGVESSSKKTEKRDSTGQFASKNYTVKTTSESKTSFSIAPGLEYHFGGSKRLDPYVGVEIPVKLIGGKTEKDEIRTEGNGFDGKSNSFNSLNETFTPGGFGFGIGLLVGFNYFVTERFALGLEYNINFDWVSEGGETKNSSKTVYDVGGTITNYTDESTSFSKETNIKGNNRGILGLNIVYFFGEK